MSITTSADPEPVSIDSGWISDFIRRWKLADDYVSDLANPEAPPAEHAVKRLVRVDVPVLMKELVRLRPELTH